VYEKIDYDKYKDSDDDAEIQINQDYKTYFRTNLLQRHTYISPFVKVNVFNPRVFKLYSLLTLIFINLLLNSVFYTIEYKFTLVR